MLAIEVTRMRADFIFVGRVINDSGVVAAKMTDLEIWAMLNTGRYFMYFPICLRMGLLLFGADSNSRRYCLAKVPSAWPILAKSGTIIEEWHYIILGNCVNPADNPTSTGSRCGEISSILLMMIG